ncbi:hypothetical protein LP420_06565 [Massilia sp. B-10]|nr:hypothetical protein LP420_06565 [Massilia sp. B-10]
MNGESIPGPENEYNYMREMLPSITLGRNEPLCARDDSDRRVQADRLHGRGQQRNN